jgi:predicted Fe-S protein YdhL (DUF1289 family)
MYVTPCISICFIDPGTKSCTGCNRTAEEIREWTKYTHEQRMEVMIRLGYGKRSCMSERMRRYDRG